MYRNLGSLPIESWIPGKKIDIMSANKTQVSRASLCSTSLYTSRICMSEFTYVGEHS